MAHGGRIEGASQEAGVLLKTLLKVSLYEKAGGSGLDAFPRARIKLGAIRKK